MEPVLIDYDTLGFLHKKHAGRTFAIKEDQVEFVRSGGSLMRALLFRSIQDSLSRDLALVEESRQWLDENLENMWRFLFIDDAKEVYDWIAGVWDRNDPDEFAKVRSTITYIMSATDIVDPEGESRFDPLKHRRDRRKPKALHTRGEGCD